MITRCTRCKQESRKTHPVGVVGLFSHLCDDCFQGLLIYLLTPTRRAGLVWRDETTPPMSYVEYMKKYHPKVYPIPMPVTFPVPNEYIEYLTYYDIF